MSRSSRRKKKVNAAFPQVILPQPERCAFPLLLKLFNQDQESLEDFLESLHDHEVKKLKIVEKDPNQLRKFVIHIRNDLDDTAKALEMDG